MSRTRKNRNGKLPKKFPGSGKPKLKRGTRLILRDGPMRIVDFERLNRRPEVDESDDDR